MDEDARTLVLWTIRRTLGVAVAFLLFYLATPLLWDLPPLSAPDVLAILVVVHVGVLLGLAMGYVWPLQAKTGLARAIRTVIFSIPAFGFGMAVHITVGGPTPSRAYWFVFAASVLLGSVYFTKKADEAAETDPEAPDETDESVPEADGEEVPEAVADVGDD